MPTNAFSLSRSITLLLAGASLAGACASPDRLERTGQAGAVPIGLDAGAGSDGGTAPSPDSGTGPGSDGGVVVVDPPPLQDYFTFQGYAGPCPVTTAYNYSGTSASGTVTIRSPDYLHAVTMPFNGNESSFGFSFGAASGQYVGGQEYWSGDDRPNDAAYAWLAQCGDTYAQAATTTDANAGFDLMADCTNFQTRYTAALQNRDTAAGRATTDNIISVGSFALSMSPARFLRFGAMGVRGTRIGLGATSLGAQLLGGQNTNNASSFASAANAHCDGWNDCCAQPGGPHTACPSSCRNNHGAGKGS